MEDNDIILPADPEAEAREAAAKEYIEKQNEIDEANKRLYERAWKSREGGCCVATTSI